MPDRLKSKRRMKIVVGVLMFCSEDLTELRSITAEEGGVLKGADVTHWSVSPVCLTPAWICVCWISKVQRSGSGCGVTWTWESGLNSRHSPTSEGLVCLPYNNLSHILCVFVRALCQAHWLWKNNLTGFNLYPPPPRSSSLPSTPLCVCFFFFVRPLRGWECILFGNSMPGPSLLYKSDRWFGAASLPPVVCTVTGVCHHIIWHLKQISVHLCWVKLWSAAQIWIICLLNLCNCSLIFLLLFFSFSFIWIRQCSVL